MAKTIVISKKFVTSVLYAFLIVFLVFFLEHFYGTKSGILLEEEIPTRADGSAVDRFYAVPKLDQIGHDCTFFGWMYYSVSGEDTKVIDFKDPYQPILFKASLVWTIGNTILIILISLALGFIVYIFRTGKLKVKLQ